mmetsp:Transcript_6167/g.19991  ORF Transcript_6167/g.19991 Transcript_6167/m.19991 type:complete len:112 (-) Transcript_6167:610-945(-)
MLTSGKSMNVVQRQVRLFNCLWPKTVHRIQHKRLIFRQMANVIRQTGNGLSCTKGGQQRRCATCVVLARIRHLQKTCGPRGETSIMRGALAHESEQFMYQEGKTTRGQGQV